MFAKRILASSAVVAVLAGAALGGARPSSGSGPEGRYVVRSGDTLWAIAAARYASDPRKAIWDIRQRNRLGSSGLHPGQVLVLPAP
jgi:nucleoid-associated protein YgaU